MADVLETVAPGAPVTAKRPVPTDLDKHLKNPGMPRAVVAPSRENPAGSRTFHDPKGLSVLQQHVEFFDRNKDGLVHPWETYSSFWASGFNVLLSLIAALLINGSMSYPTQDSWLPDLLWSIKIKNIHQAKHGSDSETYDTEGRFVPEKFEELFTKHDRDNKGALPFWELLDLTENNKNCLDAFGWTAAKLEWGVLYWILADHRGRVAKEHVRESFDGSLFYRIEKERKGDAQRSKHGQVHPEYYSRASKEDV